MSVYERGYSEKKINRKTCVCKGKVERGGRREVEKVTCVCVCV